uniref:Uncharacterized protein n=1 Tax=Romanomermis culicivorax TaxID=13658 RepID=A0A915JHG7_ROMCU
MATVLTPALRSIISCCSRTKNQDCYFLFNCRIYTLIMSVSSKTTCLMEMLYRKSCEKSIADIKNNFSTIKNLSQNYDKWWMI